MVREVEDTSGEDLVRVYLREIGRHPLLGADQEVTLAKAIESGLAAEKKLAKSNGSLSAKARGNLEKQIAEGERARRAFIESNLRLVVSIARRYQGVAR